MSGFQLWTTTTRTTLKCYENEIDSNFNEFYTPCTPFLVSRTFLCCCVCPHQRHKTSQKLFLTVIILFSKFGPAKDIDWKFQKKKNSRQTYRAYKILWFQINILFCEKQISCSFFHRFIDKPKDISSKRTSAHSQQSV